MLLVTLIFILICTIVLFNSKHIKKVENAVAIYPHISDTIPPDGFDSFPACTMMYCAYISWDYPNNTSFIVEPIQPTDVIILESTISYKKNAAFFQYNFSNNPLNPMQYKIRAIKNDSLSEPVIVTSRDIACFPKGSKVIACYDYHSQTIIFEKKIEDVKVGDYVIGAFGEINQVMGIQKVFVGENKLFSINGNHITTDHHPHITSSKTFLVCENIDIISDLYNKPHQIFDGEKNIMKHLDGLNSQRIQKMKIGDQLKNLNGYTIVNSITAIEMDKEETLYNLEVSGSHTYFVDNYAVTGWPSEKTFDYDTWTEKKVDI